MPAELGWLVAAVQAAFFVGWLVGRRLPRPGLRPYRNPILTRAINPEHERQDELAAARAAEGAAMKLSEAELNAFVMDIQREAGVDEETARLEVDFLLKQAGEVGQG